MGNPGEAATAVLPARMASGSGVSTNLVPKGGGQLQPLIAAYATGDCPYEKRTARSRTAVRAAKTARTATARDPPVGTRSRPLPGGSSPPPPDGVQNRRQVGPNQAGRAEFAAGGRKRPQKLSIDPPWAEMSSPFQKMGNGFSPPPRRRRQIAYADGACRTGGATGSIRGDWKSYPRMRH